MKRNIFFILLFIITSSLFAGLPHTAYVEVSLNSQNDHPQSLTFNAWIVGRESEILTETSGGCGYIAEEGLLYVQAGTFPTQWSAGNILHIEVTAQEGGTGVGEFELTNNGGDFFGPTHFSSLGINLWVGFKANKKIAQKNSIIEFNPNPFKNVKSYKWDFNNDGIWDSTDKNPSYIFRNIGKYTVKLEVTYQNHSKQIFIRKDFITIK